MRDSGEIDLPDPEEKNQRDNLQKNMHFQNTMVLMKNWRQIQR